jgi:hypothetical protein
VETVTSPSSARRYDHRQGHPTQKQDQHDRHRQQHRPSDLPAGAWADRDIGLDRLRLPESIDGLQRVAQSRLFGEWLLSVRRERAGQR